MTTLVTGSTGNLGSLVVSRLLARGVDPSSVVAGARTPARADHLATLGVRVRRMDYDEPETVRDALSGVDRVLLVSAGEPGRRVAQHQEVIDAAARVGVELLVYTSLIRADTSPLALAPDHVATERAIATSGVPAAILRNDWYTENYVRDLQRAANTGVIEAAVGGGRVASATHLDYADAAATVLTGDGHTGAVYELAGDVAWDYHELAATAAEVLGRPVTFRPLNAEEQRAALIANGLGPATAEFFVGLETGIRDGALDSEDRTLSRLIGRPTTPLVAGLRAALAHPAH